MITSESQYKQLKKAGRLRPLQIIKKLKTKHTHNPNQKNKNPRNTSGGKYRRWLKERPSRKKNKWANGCNPKLSSHIILTEASYLNPVHPTTKTSILIYEVLYPPYIPVHTIYSAEARYPAFPTSYCWKCNNHCEGMFLHADFFLLSELFSADN